MLTANIGSTRKGARSQPLRYRYGPVSAHLGDARSRTIPRLPADA